MKKLFSILSLFLLTFTVLLFTSCKENDVVEFEGVTIVDQAQREVTIEKEPTKIISGYYISSSMLLALGEKENLIGVENMQKGMAKRFVYEKAGINFDEIGGFGTKKAFNTEKALEKEPDLIVLPYSLKAQADEISTVCNCPVIVVNPESDVLMEEALTILAKATNSEQRKEDLISYTKSKIEDNKIENKSSSAYFVSASGDFLSTLTGNAYQSQMLKNAGLNNVALDLEGFNAEVSYEQVLAWNPDYIIIASDSSVNIEDVLADSNLSEIKAVKNNNVFKIPSDVEAWDSPIPAVFLASLYINVKTGNLSEDNFNSIANEFYTTFYGFSLND